MKVAGNGQAKTLNSDELRLLFDKSLTNPRDRTLFAICLLALLILGMIGERCDSYGDSEALLQADR